MKMSAPIKHAIDYSIEFWNSSRHCLSGVINHTSEIYGKNEVYSTIATS